MYDREREQILILGSPSLSYNLTFDQWRTLPTANPTPFPRSGASVVFVKRTREVFLFGGYTNVYFDELWKYSIDSNAWTQIQKVNPLVWPVARSGHCLEITSSGEIVMFGGYSSSNQYLSDVWLFNVTTNSWRQITPLGSSIPSGRSYPGCEIAKTDQLIVMFGTTRNGALSDA